MIKTSTVDEAIELVNNGSNLEGVIIDEESIKQVSTKKALILNEGGIVVPESSIYYDDNEIAYDEEIDELVLSDEITGMSWEEKAELFQASDREAIAIDISTEEPEVNN